MASVYEVHAQIDEVLRTEQDGSVERMLGQQLKDICAKDAAAAEILAEDLTAGALTLNGAAKKMQEEADRLHRQQKGGCVCITPARAEAILREYFGLPSGGGSPATPAPHPEGTDTAGAAALFDIADLL